MPTAAALLSLVVSFVPPAPGQAEMSRARPPGDCMSLLSAPAAGLLSWRETMSLEHCDRTRRLMRLSDVLPASQAPLFYDTVISRADLPAAIGADVPMLRVVFPERVFFRTDSAELTSQARQVVRIVSDSLRSEPPDVTLFIAGHADARGPRDYNQALSVDRANALAGAISAQGTGVATLWRVGFGEDMPLKAGTDRRAYGLNRRIEFLFAAKPEAISTWLADQQIDLLCAGRTTEETSACREAITFETTYEVAEISGTDPERVDPDAKSLSIDLSGTRRIRIDPTNRRAGEPDPGDASGGID